MNSVTSRLGAEVTAGVRVRSATLPMDGCSFGAGVLRNVVIELQRNCVCVGRECGEGVW